MTLVSYGAVISFAAKDNHAALLVLPWVSIILGWGYLVNDEKASSMGRYVHITLSERIAALLKVSNADDLFGWEIAHRSDPRRLRRKIEQLIVDQIIFVFSGYVAIIAYCVLVPEAPRLLLIIAGIEGVLLAALALEIALYADLKKGR